MKVAEELFRMMTEESLTPDRISFDCIVRTCARCGKLDRAEYWFRKALTDVV